MKCDLRPRGFHSGNSLRGAAGRLRELAQSIRMPLGKIASERCNGLVLEEDCRHQVRAEPCVELIRQLAERYGVEAIAADIFVRVDLRRLDPQNCGNHANDLTRKRFRLCEPGIRLDGGRFTGRGNRGLAACVDDWRRCLVQNAPHLQCISVKHHALIRLPGESRFQRLHCGIRGQRLHAQRVAEECLGCRAHGHAAISPQRPVDGDCPPAPRTLRDPLVAGFRKAIEEAIREGVIALARISGYARKR